jgi:hypothetical protein
MESSEMVLHHTEDDMNDHTTDNGRTLVVSYFKNRGVGEIEEALEVDYHQADDGEKKSEKAEKPEKSEKGHHS